MYETIIEHTLPNALMIGVDYNIFWTLNPKTLSPFIKAFHLREELEDSHAWQLGAYIRMAITSSMGKNSKYPKAPLLSKSKSKSKVKEKSEAEDFKERFSKHVELLNSRFK